MSFRGPDLHPTSFWKNILVSSSHHTLCGEPFTLASSPPLLPLESPSSVLVLHSQQKPRLSCSGKPGTHSGPREPRRASHTGLCPRLAVRRAAPPASCWSESSSNGPQFEPASLHNFKLPQPFRFVNILGHSPIEYNQEQARLRTYSGEESLIRSFPYAVFDSNTRAYKTHTPLLRIALSQI